MKCRIMQEMSFEPISQRVGPEMLVENAEDYVFPELNVRTVWTWVAQFWDDGDPPWRDGSKYVHTPIPKTWAVRETIHIGYL